MCFEQQIAGETLVKSCQISDSVWHRQASTRSSARKPGYLTFPVVELRVSVAWPAQPVWNFSPRFRSEFLPLGDARGSFRTAGVALGASGEWCSSSVQRDDRMIRFELHERLAAQTIRSNKCRA
jgi:hypothetical protein